MVVNATKEEGEFYTPHDVAQLIVAMIDPYEGTLYKIKTRHLIQFNTV
ncbi:MAG: N-6 DNA methylase [Thomasclavelia spiroformis]|nr:N-6 DNA methylase [Thomasclavelia spiroformis]